MTAEETKKIIATIVASFPNYKPNDMKMTLSVWSTMFQDYDFKLVGAALKTYISEDHEFAPSIGQLIAKVNQITSPEDMNAMEAWSLVDRAIRDSTYHAQERFDELPEVIQKAVGSADNLRNWGQSDIHSIETVVQSNFIKTYHTTVERQKQLKALPSDIRALIENTSKAVGIESNE